MSNCSKNRMLGHATSVTCTWIMPAFGVPVRITMSSSYTRLRGKHLAEPVPLEPYCLMTNVDATLGQQVLDLAQLKRISDIHHHRQANDLG